MTRSACYDDKKCLSELLSCAEDRESSPHARLANQAIDTGWKQARPKTHTHAMTHSCNNNRSQTKENKEKQRKQARPKTHTHTCHDTQFQQQQKPNKENVSSYCLSHWNQARLKTRTTHTVARAVKQRNCVQSLCHCGQCVITQETKHKTFLHCSWLLSS